MSALESSITLDDVFVVVGAKRVPLAPELAGYLALEIAEGAGPNGEVDPRSVYIGEEGSVALVRKRDPREARDAREPTGDAEESIRAILARLLEASGSQTTGLAAVARRRTSAGLGALIEELEAALIPVNRAAGRRALARLAREVKRVTLGVGRNAALAPNEPAREPGRRGGSSPSYSAVRDGGAPQSTARPAPEDARPPSGVDLAPAPPGTSRPRPNLVEEAPPPTTARREPPAETMASSVPSEAHFAPPSVDPADLPTVELRKDQLAAATAALMARSRPPLAVEKASAPLERTPAPPVGSDVDQLLASFGVSGGGEKTASRELKALVGLEPTPPPLGSLGPTRPGVGPPESRPEDSRGAHDADLDALLAGSDPGPPAVERPVPPSHVLASPPTAISPALANEPIGRGTASSTRGSASRVADVAPTMANAGMPTPAPARPPEPLPAPPLQTPPATRSSPTGPSMRKIGDLREYREPRAPRTDRALTVAALVILLGGAAGIYFLKPSFLLGHPTPHSTASAPPPAPTPSPSALAAKCREALVVTDAPNNAEVLLRVGQAPIDVEKMPVGARLEFVATAEGFAPKRAVVPAEATWEPGADGKPRFELPVQLDKSRARAGAVDPWPAAEPGSEVGGKGSPGTVHVVTLPRGAEVWLLAGLGPEARIDQLPCTANDVDVLVAGPANLRKRLHVSQSDFVAVDGGTDRVATIKAK